MRRFALALAAATLLLPLAAEAQVPFKAVLTQPGISNVIPLPTGEQPPVGLLLNMSNGATANCEVDVSGYADGPWNPHDTLVAVTASANGNIAFPVGFVRLNCSALSGGAVTLTVIVQ
jgi:hypothetical protein